MVSSSSISNFLRRYKIYEAHIHTNGHKLTSDGVVSGPRWFPSNINLIVFIWNPCLSQYACISFFNWVLRLILKWTTDPSYTAKITFTLSVSQFQLCFTYWSSDFQVYVFILTSWKVWFDIRLSNNELNQHMGCWKLYTHTFLSDSDMMIWNSVDVLISSAVSLSLLAKIGFGGFFPSHVS